eukprot:m.357229 g.357229  ORF g.357229 m.357229 type:complete len:427 (-) comp55968_c0_seq4:113-1393(-)
MRSLNGGNSLVRSKSKRPKQMLRKGRAHMHSCLLVFLVHELIAHDCARSSSLRAQFAVSDTENALHGSGRVEAAYRHIFQFFPDWAAQHLPKEEAVLLIETQHVADSKAQLVTLQFEVVAELPLKLAEAQAINIAPQDETRDARVQELIAADLTAVLVRRVAAGLALAENASQLTGIVFRDNRSAADSKLGPLFETQAAAGDADSSTSDKPTSEPAPPVKTASTTQPAKTASTSQPTKTASTAQPSDPAKTASAAQPSDAAKTASTAQPAKTASTSEPAKTASTAQPAKTASTAQPSEPAKTASTSVPAKTASTAQPSEPAKAASTSEPAKTASSTQPVEPAKTASAAQPSEPTKVASAAQNAQPDPAAKQPSVAPADPASSASADAPVSEQADAPAASSSDTPASDAPAAQEPSADAGEATPSSD